MKVSIITPTYNSADFVGSTIKSIQAQSYTDWELLITDDCSKDNTLEVLERYAAKDDRIKVFCLKENGGAGVARNNSIAQATGRFIAFCDSDDAWKPQKLEKQVAFMLNNAIDFSYTGYDVVNEYGKVQKTIIPPTALNYKKQLCNNYIGCLTAMYDTHNLGKVYMEKIRKRQDWILWLKILKQCDARGISESLAMYTLREDSISSNKLKLVKNNWLVYRDYENCSSFKATFMMLRFLCYYYIYKIWGKH